MDFPEMAETSSSSHFRPPSDRTDRRAMMFTPCSDIGSNPSDVASMTSRILNRYARGSSVNDVTRISTFIVNWISVSVFYASVYMTYQTIVLYNHCRILLLQNPFINPHPWPLVRLHKQNDQIFTNASVKIVNLINFIKLIEWKNDFFVCTK